MVNIIPDLPVNKDLGGGYQLFVDIHAHQLNTKEAYCIPSHIRAKIQPEHFNIKLYEEGNEVFNLHGGSYRDSGDICLFMFESETEIDYCFKQCFDNDPGLGEISAFVEDAIRELEEKAKDFEHKESGAAAVAAAAIVAAIAYIGPAKIAATIAALWAIPVLPPPP